MKPLSSRDTSSRNSLFSKDWRRYFYVLTGLTGLCTLSIIAFIPDVHPAHIDLWGQIDWIGSLLVSVGLVLMLYVFTMAPSSDNGWGTTCKSSLLKTLAMSSLNGCSRYNYHSSVCVPDHRCFRHLGMAPGKTKSDTTFASPQHLYFGPWTSGSLIRNHSKYSIDLVLLTRLDVEPFCKDFLLFGLLQLYVCHNAIFPRVFASVPAEDVGEYTHFARHEHPIYIGSNPSDALSTRPDHVSRVIVLSQFTTDR